jgi:hypothetical protein
MPIEIELGANNPVHTVINYLKRGYPERPQ